MSSEAGGNNEVISIPIVLNPIVDKSKLEKEINQSKEPQIGDTRDNTTRNNADNARRDSQGRLSEELIRDSNGQVVPVGRPTGGVAGGTLGSAAVGVVAGNVAANESENVFRIETEKLKKSQLKATKKLKKSQSKEIEKLKKNQLKANSEATSLIKSFYKKGGDFVSGGIDTAIKTAFENKDFNEVSMLMFKKQYFEGVVERKFGDISKISTDNISSINYQDKKDKVETDITNGETTKPNITKDKTTKSDITKGKTPLVAPDSTNRITKIKTSLGVGQKGAKNIESLATNPEALIGGNLRRLLPAAGIIGIIALALLEAPNFMKSIVKALAVKGGPLNQDFHRFIADEVQLGINRDQQWRRSRGLDVIITTEHRDYILSDPAFINNSLVDGDPTRAERLNSNETRLGYGNGL